MTAVRARPVQLVLLLAGLAAVPVPDAMAQGLVCEPTDPEEFDACVEQHTTALIEAGFPGFSVGVVHGDSIVYERSFGVADRESGRTASSTTVYQIGSVTKSFTGLLFARLIEARLVGLGDPIARYLPEGTAVPTDSAGAVITLQHLATHTSGLPRYPANLERQDGDPMLGGFTEMELLEGLSSSELLFPIGTRISYSNFGYGLLAHLLERATGESYEQLLRRHVLVTPALQTVSLEPRARSSVHLATPYRDDDPTVPTRPWEMGTLSGAGGLFASVEALADFLTLLMESAGRAGDPEMRDALRLMQTPFYRYRSPDWVNWGYGLGCFVIEDWEGTGERVIHHGGDLDGYAAAYFAAPRSGIGVVYLTNSSMGPVLAESNFTNWLMRAALTVYLLD